MDDRPVLWNGRENATWETFIVNGEGRGFNYLEYLVGGLIIEQRCLAW